MKYIESKRVHIPVITEYINRKFLDIQYAEGDDIIKGARHNLADFETEEIYEIEENFLQRIFNK